MESGYQALTYAYERERERTEGKHAQEGAEVQKEGLRPLSLTRDLETTVQDLNQRAAK